MKKHLIILFLLTIAPFVRAQSQVGTESTPTKAHLLYEKEQYAPSIEIYRALLLQEGNAPTAALYYNLGNAYYRNGDLGWAIVAYERALRLSPRDRYIQHNLQIASSQTTDRLEYIPSYLEGVWSSICYLFSPLVWCILSVGFFLLLASALFVFRFMRQRIARQIAFYTGIVSLLLFFFNGFVVWQLVRDYRNDQWGIVVKGQVAAKSAPSGDALTLFVLHEGSKLATADLPEEAGQIAVTLPDGTLGWIPVQSFVPIYPLQLTETQKP